MSFIIHPRGDGFEVLNQSLQWTPMLDFAKEFDADEAQTLARTHCGAVAHRLRRPEADGDVIDASKVLFATMVPERRRMEFLPALFGHKQVMLGEAMVYSYMDQLCESYNGGYWEFFEINNGARYLSPRLDRKLTISVDGNGFSASMSCDAAGIVATIFALAAMHSRTGLDQLVDTLDGLKDFAAGHPEASQIFRSID